MISAAPRGAAPWRGRIGPRPWCRRRHDQHQPLAGHLLATRGDLKAPRTLSCRALYSPPAGACGGHAAASPARQAFGLLRHVTRELRRLVEPAQQDPRAVQRHRQDRVAALDGTV